MDLPQGTLDLLILKVVALGPVHGYAIAQRLQQVSRDVVQVPQGSLYPALHRLENRGLLAADWKETETGREAKFYRLTRKGRAQLDTETESWRQLAEAVAVDPQNVRRRRGMTWWSRLLRRKQIEEQLDKELRFHLEQHTADLIARGHDPSEARRQARLALGGPEQVKEECRDARGTRWLEDLWQDLRYALRTLRQKPGFAVIALATLATRHRSDDCDVHGYQWRSPKATSLSESPTGWSPCMDRLKSTANSGGFRILNFSIVSAQSRSLGPMAAWTYSGGTVSEPGEAQYVDGREISSELFSVLGISLSKGRAFLPEEDRPGAAPVIIISYGLWQRRFGGSPGAIGRALVYDGKPYTVVGVAPAGLRLDGEADVFTPLGQSTRPQMQNRGARFIHVLGRLRTGRDA